MPLLLWSVCTDSPVAIIFLIDKVLLVNIIVGGRHIISSIAIVLILLFISVG